MCRCATLYNAAAPRGQPPAAAAATPFAPKGAERACTAEFIYNANVGRGVTSLYNVQLLPRECV